MSRQAPKIETSFKKLAQEVTEMRQAIANVESACLEAAAVAHQENWGTQWETLLHCAKWAQKIVESLFVWERNDSVWDDNQFKLAQALAKDTKDEQGCLGLLNNTNFLKAKFEELRDATAAKVRELQPGCETSLPAWLKQGCKYDDIKEPWDFVRDLREMESNDLFVSPETQVRISEELYDAVSSYAAVVSCIGAFRQLESRFKNFTENSQAALDEVYGFRREKNQELVQVHDEVVNLKQRWDACQSEELRQEAVGYRNRVVLLRDRAVLDEIDPPPEPEPPGPEPPGPEPPEPQVDVLDLADDIHNGVRDHGRRVDKVSVQLERFPVLIPILLEAVKCLLYLC